MPRQPFDPNMTRAEYNRLNRKLIPWNVVIAIIALTITIMLFFGSFFRVNINMPLGSLGEFVDGENGFTAGQSQLINPQLTGENNGDSDNDNGGGFDGIFDDMIDDIIEHMANFEIRLTVAMSNFSLLQGLAGSPTQTVVGNTANHVVRQLYDLAFMFSREVLPMVAESFIEIISQEAAENDEVDSDDFLEALDAGALAEALVDILNGEFTVVEARNKLMSILTPAFEAAVDDPNELQEVLDDVEYYIGNFLDDMYEFLANEEGYIDLGSALVVILSDWLDIEVEDGIDGLGAALVGFTLNLLYEIDPIFVTLIDVFFYILAAMHLVTIFVWFMLFLFALIRIFTKKKRLLLGFAGGIGWITFSLFIILPAIVFLALMLPTGLLAYFSVTFIAMTLASFLGSWAMLIILLAGYGRLKRRVKRARVID